MTTCRSGDGSLTYLQEHDHIEALDLLFIPTSAKRQLGTSNSPSQPTQHHITQQFSILVQLAQNPPRRNIKRAARDGRRKVQDAIVLPRRIPDKHALEHLLHDPEPPRVADEVSAKDAGPGRAKGHVVAQDAVLVAVLVLDGGERLVRLLRAGGLVVELDVVGLCTADDGFLVGGREGAPRGHVVDVFLDDDVAAAHAGLVVVLFGDEDRFGEGGGGGVGGAVDEAEEVAGVKVAEALGVVLDGDGGAEEAEELAFELEADVAPVGADVEEQVAGGGGCGVALAVDGAEGMELGWLGEV